MFQNVKIDIVDKVSKNGKQYEVVVLTLANGRKIEICDFGLVDRLYAEAFRMKNK